MAVTILEALMNADYNLTKNSGSPFALRMGADQLHNAVVLLDKGYGLNDEVEPLLEEHGDVDSVPVKGSAERIAERGR